MIPSLHSCFLCLSFYLYELFLLLLHISFLHTIVRISFSAVNTVNEYVKEKTNSLIPQMLEKLPPDGVLLINTLYFKAQFEHKFEGEFTRHLDFDLFSGEKKQIDTMIETYSFLYYETGDAQVCLLPFEGKHSDAALLLILPHNHTPSALCECANTVLSADRLPHVLSHLTREEVHLLLPKFRVEFDVDVAEMMKNEGVNDATNKTKGCARIGHSQEQLLHPELGEWCYIQSVLHKTVLDVNEEGVEAAAATVVVMPPDEGDLEPPPIPPPPPIPMHCTRPFILALVNRRHSYAFFSAIITDPPPSNKPVQMIFDRNSQ